MSSHNEDINMGQIQNWDTESLAKALKPGLEAMIGHELDSLINEAVLEATNKVRKELVERSKLVIESRLERILEEDNIDLHIDLVIHETK
jgi:hypothetical protein